MSVNAADVRRSLDSIRANLEDGWLDSVSNQELQDNTAIIDQLDSQNANAVIAGLSDEELGKWISEINEGGFLGGGLDATERDALYDVLAADLEPDQLIRVHDSLDTEDQRTELIDSIATESIVQVRGAVIERLAPRALDTPTELHPQLLGIGGTLREVGDDDALAIGRLLGSLNGYPAALDAAVASLGDETLEAVLVAGIQESSLTHVVANGNTGSATTSVLFDPSVTIGVIEAATAGASVQTRTRVFDLASRRIDDVRATDTLLQPNVSAGGVAGSLSDALGGLLASDTNGIVTALESGSVSESHRYGNGLSSYTTEVIRQGDTKPLTEAIAKLQSGEALKADPEAFLSQHTVNAQGARNYQNASNLGYFVGAVHEGIDAIESDAAKQAEIVTAVFGTAFGVAGPFLPKGSVAAPVAAAIARTLTLETLDARADDLTAGRASLGQALEQLAWPDGVNNSDLENTFEAASQRIRNN